MKNPKNIIFYIKSKYFRYTFASYGVIPLKIMFGSVSRLMRFAVYFEITLNRK